MARYLLLTFAFLIAGIAASAQASLQGTVTDAENGQPIIFGTVALYKNGVLMTGTETDLDGYYSITELDPGTYDVVFSYTGYQELRIADVAVLAGKANKLDAKVSAGVTLTEIVVTYERPIIEQDNTTQGATLSSEEIKNLPTRNVNALASLGAGVASSDEGEDLAIRGSRTNATNYYIDGVRVSGRMIPKQNIEQLQVITGGVEARYGDVTGGIISITSKGPSEEFSGGLELETSKFLDPYDQRLASLNLSGPLWKRKGQTIIGYRVGGQYQYNLDDDPPAISVYRVKDDVLQRLEDNPIRVVGNTVFPEAEYITNDDVDAMDYKPNEERTTYDLNAKIDANLGKAVDVTFSGTFYRIEDKFTPAQANGATWRVFNSQNNPTDFDTRYRANVRLRHRLGGATTSSSTEEGEANVDQKGALIQNAAYILQFGYEKELTERADKNHGDNLFDYGYIGDFDLSWEPSIGFNIANDQRIIGADTFNIIRFSAQHNDYTRTLQGYTANTDINPVLTKYILNPDDNDDFNDFLVINGRVPSNFQNVWTNLHTGVGMVYNLNRKRDNDIYTFNANTSFELVPGGSGSARHNIQFGVMYEQRTRRGYDINPIGLWTAARGHANEHIEGQGLDTLSTPIGFTEPLPYLELDQFTGDTILYVPDSMYPIYSPNIVTGSTDNTFFRKVRAAYNVPLNQYFNVDGLNPNELQLDWFSARELMDENIINYWGYDYLGNKIDDVTFDDFFKARDADGIRTFPVAAFRPNYQSAYIQDKFTFKDVIFRVGVRVDRYDANTKVMKDPYSLYEVMSASEFDSRFGTQRPGNIGEDYKVYVTSEGGETVQAYRDGDSWYFPNGNPANDGAEIYGGSIVYPRYKEDIEEKRDVTSQDFDPNISFEDYKPQINWMPRLAFSFPISDDANFFAHYDVLVQRPPSNNFVSPLTYFYWETRNTNIQDNANLKPERTVDYEVGFQQRLGQTSAIKLSAYYKELRDMIQSRFFTQVPAPVNTYETYDNLDFATVKGFVVSYEMRRTGNISLNLAYTLQFANGTGSDANSSRSISSRGIQRTLFPMSFDERHRLSGIVDYRFGSGKKYNGPRIGGLDILSNTGLNLTAIVVSGRPYTSAIEPDVLGSRGIEGAINGSRLPWNYTFNAQLDKSFNLTKAGAARSLAMNVYLRVSNLLNRRNTIDVYKYTGSPEDDGFLNSADGRSFINGGITEGRSLDAFLASYQWRLLNPDYYSLPRRIFLGATLDF